MADRDRGSACCSHSRLGFAGGDASPDVGQLLRHFAVGSLLEIDPAEVIGSLRESTNEVRQAGGKTRARPITPDRCPWARKIPDEKVIARRRASGAETNEPFQPLAPRPAIRSGVSLH